MLEHDIRPLNSSRADSIGFWRIGSQMSFEDDKHVTIHFHVNILADEARLTIDTRLQEHNLSALYMWQNLIGILRL